MRILLIEDESEDVSLLAAELLCANPGRSLLVLRNAQKAIEFIDTIQADQVDLIVVDLLLADQSSGFEVLRHLHATRSSLPVIVWTSNHHDTFEKICYLLGARAVIGKTFKRRRGVASLREEVQRYELPPS